MDQTVDTLNKRLQVLQMQRNDALDQLVVVGADLVRAQEAVKLLQDKLAAAEKKDKP